MLLSIRHMSHKKEMIEWMEMAKLNSILFNLMTGDYREIKQIRNLLKWDRDRGMKERGKEVNKTVWVDNNDAI